MVVAFLRQKRGWRPRWTWCGGLAALVCAWLLVSTVAQAQQQVQVGQPFNNVSDSVFESFGFSGALRGPNWFANWGGAAAPPFGNFNPQAGATGGSGVQGRGFNGAFGFQAAQGFSRSSISQTPGLTVTNGGSGFIGDQQFSPFVLGVVPVVGDQGPWGQRVPTYPAIPWQMRYRAAAVDEQADDDQNAAVAAQHAAADQARPAARNKPIDTLKLSRGEAQSKAADRVVEGSAAPARSVAEIRAAQQDEDATTAAEAQDYFERGQEAESADKLGVAKIYYQMAARRAGAELRSQIEARLKNLSRQP